MSGTARLFCCYTCCNAPHAIGWLIQASGFERVRQEVGANGAVLHAELRLGDVVIMVASADENYLVPKSSNTWPILLRLLQAMRGHRLTTKMADALPLLAWLHIVATLER